MGTPQDTSGTGMSDGVSDLPHLSAGLPGTRGRIKCRDDDFVVEEIPRYRPCGSGTHLYFGIEKRGLSTLAAVERIARALGRKTNDIGYAGLKDAHAVTRQTFSLEHVEAPRVHALDLPRVHVLWTDRHTNKLKLGHLGGNRFVVKFRDMGPAAMQRAEAIVDVLVRRGVPNYFGPQRFGARGDNAAVGQAVLRSDYDAAVRIVLGSPDPEERADIRAARTLFEEGHYAEAARAWPPRFGDQARLCGAMVRANGNARRAWSSVHQTIRRLYISAEQSRLFNQVLAARIDALDRLQTGDLAWKHANGACFHVLDAAAESPRCDAFEISPTGPLFGTRMTNPTGKPGRLEAGVLAAAGWQDAVRQRRPDTPLQGARRPLRVPLGEPALTEGGDEHGPYLQMTFTLPPGRYATCVTREIDTVAGEGTGGA